jgi:hypothetical protein
MEQAIVEHLDQLIRYLAPHPLEKPKSTDDYDKTHVNFVESMLHTQVPLDKVEVQTSPIHGRGVFAKQKIHPGDLITIYPAHYISFHPEGRGKSGRECHIPECYGEKKGLVLTDVIRHSYAFDVTENYVIYGHPDLTHDPAFLGHMINDGARGHSTKASTIKRMNGYTI